MLLAVLQKCGPSQLCHARCFTVGLFALAFTNAIDVHAGTGVREKATVYGAQTAVIPLTQNKVALQIGRPDSIQKLVLRLLETMRYLSRYDVDVPLPIVRATPLAEMHRRLCVGPCAIRAAYVPGEGLYYDAAMRPLTNRYDQSILFHELVHHVQVVNGSHPSDRECRRWGAREVEAYTLQNRFLNSLGVASRAFNPGRMCAPV